MHMHIWISITGEVGFEEGGSTGQILTGGSRWTGEYARHQGFPRDEATEVTLVTANDDVWQEVKHWTVGFKSPRGEC